VPMEVIPKCLLLQIDSSEESLRPIRFLGRLYPDVSRMELILSYLQPPLPPVYHQFPMTPSLADRKKELLHSREAETRAILERAKRILEEVGFSEDKIQEHVQERESSVAHHACHLAERKKVDAVLIQNMYVENLRIFFGMIPRKLCSITARSAPFGLPTGRSTRAG